MLYLLKGFGAIGADYPFIAANGYGGFYQLCDIGIVFYN